MIVNDAEEGLGEKEQTDEEIAQAIYGCEDSPLAYIIEPRGSIRFTREDEEVKKEDLESIL